MPRQSTLPKLLAVLKEIECTNRRRVGMTRPELAEAAGIAVSSARSHIEALHAAHEVYIVGWQVREGQGAGVYAPRWRLGNKPDAPKPERPDYSEYHRRHIAKVKREGGYADLLENKRLWNKRKRLLKRPPRRSRLDTALFGPPGLQAADRDDRIDPQ